MTAAVAQVAAEGDLPMEPDESEGRRLLELRLLHQFVTHTVKTMPGGDKQYIRDIWANEVPPLAIKHSFLLNSILTLAAQHLSALETDPILAAEYRSIRRKYLALCLSAHSRAISCLSADNADALCLTSLLLTIITVQPGDAFEEAADNSTSPMSTGATRSVVPESFPSMVQRVIVSHGGGEIWRKAWSWIGEAQGSKAYMLAAASPHYMESHAQMGPLTRDYTKLALVFPEEYAVQFEQLLNPKMAGASTSWQGDGDPLPKEEWDKETEETYRQALCYVGWVHAAVQSGKESPLTLCRYVMGFSAHMNRRLVELIQEGRPRALIVLAHMFALAVAVEDVWWISDTGRRVVLGVYELLPPEWKPMMNWPLRVMDEINNDRTRSPVI